MEISQGFGVSGQRTWSWPSSAPDHMGPLPSPLAAWLENGAKAHLSVTGKGWKALSEKSTRGHHRREPLQTWPGPSPAQPLKSGQPPYQPEGSRRPVWDSPKAPRYWQVWDENLILPFVSSKHSWATWTGS